MKKRHAVYALRESQSGLLRLSAHGANLEDGGGRKRLCQNAYWKIKIKIKIKTNQGIAKNQKNYLGEPRQQVNPSIQSDAKPPAPYRTLHQSTHKTRLNP